MVTVLTIVTLVRECYLSIIDRINGGRMTDLGDAISRAFTWLIVICILIGVIITLLVGQCTKHYTVKVEKRKQIEFLEAGK